MEKHSKYIYIFFQKKSIEERKKEAKEVNELIEKSNLDQLLTLEGFPVNIISNKWFRAWKKYTFFNKIFPGHKIDKDEEMEENGNEITDTLKAEEDMHDEHPGAIDQDEILDDEENLIDPEKTKDYCNYVLKRGLQENKEFLIISHKVWKYLYKIYGGREIKRWIVSVNDESAATQIEIWLKRVRK